MSKHLVESIIDGNYVQAETYFHDRLNAIMEQKLYEYKTTIDLCELVEPTGTKDEDGNPQYKGQNTKADWAKYRKQTKLPKSPKSAPPTSPLGSGKRLSAADIKKRRKAGYLQAFPALKGLEFIQKVRKYKETGKLDETTGRFIQHQVEPEMQRLKRIVIAKPVSEPAAEKGAFGIGKRPKKPTADTSAMSPELRRATLDKRRQERIRNDPAAASRLMTPKEKIKSIGKRAVSGALSGFANALTSMEEEKG